MLQKTPFEVGLSRKFPSTYFHEQPKIIVYDDYGNEPNMWRTNEIGLHNWYMNIVASLVCIRGAFHEDRPNLVPDVEL
jgi:hypothetical protein